MNVQPLSSRPISVYIVGRGHSGSTLLEILLNRNSRLAALGEIDMLGLQIYRDNERTRWAGECSCGRRPFECRVWGAAIENIRDSFDIDLEVSPFDFPLSDISLEEENGWSSPTAKLRYHMHRLRRHMPDILRRGLFGEKLDKLWVRNREFIYQAMAAIHNVDGVVDSSKDYLQMRDLLQFAESDVKVLFLTRDVRGNAWSTIRRRAGTAKRDARGWASSNSQILAFLETMPQKSWKHVRYEDLCADVDGTLSNIYDFLGVDNVPLRPNREFARRHTIAGNDVRFKPLELVISDDAWRKNLSPQQLESIRRVTGGIAEKLGYKL